MTRKLTVALLAFALACDSGEPEPPDLTGLYRLVSLTIDGLTETPPRVSAILGLSGHAVDAEGWASGAARLSIRRESPGGHSTAGGGGVYAHNARGQMVLSMRGGHQGQYTLKGDTLITSLVSGSDDRNPPRGEIVWVLDDSL